jgi:membrane-associated phospholipid phosphatase
MRSGVDSAHDRAGRPLLAASARLWAGVLLACCAILVTVLGVLVAHKAKPIWPDQAVDSRIIAWFVGHPGLAAQLAAVGTPVPAAVLSAVIAIPCLITGRLNGAVLAVAAVPASVGLNEALLKPLVHRSYYFLNGGAYPSGHTAAMFALAATVTVLLLVPPQAAGARALRILIPAAACLLGGTVAVAVIGLRWHYFTDTIAGAAVGIGTVCALALILDLPAASRWFAWASRELSRLLKKTEVARGEQASRQPPEPLRLDGRSPGDG